MSSDDSPRRERSQVAQAIDAAMKALADLDIDAKLAAAEMILARVEREAMTHWPVEDERKFMN
jgi:hypothetical protein